MKLKDIKPNPNNPRVLRDEKFQKLKQSITEFPKMLSLRPMVIDENNVVLGGNMRLRALQELGFTDIDEAWVKRSSDLTEDEKKRFIIADNVAFGEWDWDTLANDWDVVDLEAWGLEIPFYDEEVKEEQSKEEDGFKTLELNFNAFDYNNVIKVEYHFPFKHQSYVNLILSNQKLKFTLESKIKSDYKYSNLNELLLDKNKTIEILEFVPFEKYKYFLHDGIVKKVQV